MRRLFFIATIVLALCGTVVPGLAYDLRMAAGSNNSFLVSAPDLDQALAQAVETFSREQGIEMSYEPLPWSDHTVSVMDNLTAEAPERQPDLVLVDPTLASLLVAEELLLTLDEAGIVPRAENVADDSSFLPLALAGEGTYAVGLAVTRSAMDHGRLDLAIQFIEYFAEIFPEPELPDLMVAEIDAPERTEDGHVSMQLGIRNTGDAPAYEVVIHLTDDDDNVLGQSLIEAIEPGEIQYVGAEAYVEADDWAHIWVKIDPEAMLPESNIHNNVAFRKIDVQLISLNPQTPKTEKSAFCMEKKIGIGGAVGAHAKVETDGTDYLAVWGQGKLSGNIVMPRTRIVGSRYSSTGSKKGSTFVVCSTYDNLDSLSLAYGGGYYMTVWVYKSWKGQPDLVQAARISTKGTVLDTTPITVASTAGTRTANVAWTGKDFLVVFYEGGDLKGSFVSTSGSVGGKFNMGPGAYYNLALAYTPSKDHGFILYQGGTGYPSPPSVNLTGVWFSRNGTSVTVDATKVYYKQMLNKNNWTNRQDRPVVDGNDSGTYLAAWHNNLGKKWPDIYGSVVNGQPTSTLAGSMPLVKGLSEEWPALDYDGSDYIMAYTHFQGCHSYVGAMRVSPTGLRSGSKVFYNTNADLVTFVDIASNGQNAFIVFQQQVPPDTYNGPDGGTDIMGMIVK